MGLLGTLKTEEYKFTIERTPSGDGTATRGPAPFGKDKVKAPAYGPITEGKAPVPISKKGKSVQA